MRKNAVLMAIVVVAIVFALMFVAVPSPVVAQSVSLDITKIEKTDKGFVVKGTVTSSELNPEGQIVEYDDMTIVADIKEGPGSKYQKLPESFYIRDPAGAETSYTPGSGPGGTMTKEEYEGVGIDSVRIASFGLRKSPVWREYGGLGNWEKNAPATVTKDFEGNIPLKYAGKTLRIRASLRHEWGGPYAAWNARSFHHDIGYEGQLKAKEVPAPTLDSDKDGVPDDKDKCPGTPAGTEVDEKGCPKLPKGKIYGTINPPLEVPWKSQAGTLTGQQTEVSAPGSLPKPTLKEEIHINLAKIDSALKNPNLSDKNKKTLQWSRVQLTNELRNIRFREAFARRFWENVKTPFDKLMGYFPGTSTVWGIGTGTIQAARGYWKDAINRFIGAIPGYNIGTVWSGLNDFAQIVEKHEVGSDPQIKGPWVGAPLGAPALPGGAYFHP